MDKDYIINSLLIHLNETKPTEVDSSVYINRITKTNSNETVTEYYQYLMDSGLFEGSGGYLGLSKFGRTIINEYKDWYKYKRSLKKKRNFKIILGAFTVLSVIYNIYSGERNYSKDIEIQELKNTIDKLSKECKEIDNNIHSTKVLVADSVSAVGSL